MRIKGSSNYKHFLTMTPNQQEAYNRRRRARCNRRDALRLGGLDEFGRQRQACPIDLAGDRAAPVAETFPWVDWDRIPGVLRFSRREQAVWFHCFRDGSQDARKLGLSPHEQGATVREIRRKLKSNPAAIRPFLGYLSKQDLLIQKSWATDRNRAGLGGSVRSGNLRLTELHESLEAERAKLQRLTSNVERARIAHRNAEAEVDRIEASTVSERTAAAFEEREISEDHGKQLTTARGKVVTAEAGLVAARSALQRQSTVVDGIAAEIAGRQREAMLAAIKSPRAEALDALKLCADRFRTLDRIVSEHGGAPFGVDDLFPPTDPADREADWAERQQLFNIMCAIIRFDWGRERTGDLALPYYRRKVA